MKKSHADNLFNLGFVEVIPHRKEAVGLRGVFPANHLASTDN